MSSRIQSTKNYRLFQRHSGENRPLDLKKHRKLIESMKRYGFLRCFLIVVVRNENGHLIVKDGQHRLAIAEELGLTVHWVEEAVDFDVAVINSTPKVWAMRDYAQKHAANGLKDYAIGLDFADKHALPIGIAFGLLAGQTSCSNLQDKFMSGEWRITDQLWAESVAGVYSPIVAMSPAVKNSRFIEACMAACRVKEFDGARMIANAERCREKLVAYSTRDAYLDMMESVYNFGRKQLLGLKVAAQMAMRERSAAGKNSKSKRHNGNLQHVSA